MISRAGLGIGRFTKNSIIFRSNANNLKRFNSSFISPFGQNRAEKTKWFAKAVVISSVLGFTLSNYVLTDEVLEPVYKAIDSGVATLRKKANDLGLDFNLTFLEAHAFSTPDHGLHPTHYPWDFHTWWTSYDHSALRRGYQVYREICSACHSMDYIHWRNLVGVTHTENEVKEMAAEYEYRDGPNDQGEYFMRPGKLSDPMPKPYPNEEAARAANGGAYPPDLSCIARARHGEEDYLFALLTGYYDPPAGLNVREGLHYNPYFPGGAISMARAIYDESVEYEDGTPNNSSQISKDVSQFLAWASYPEHDQRKKMGLKALAISGVLLGMSLWWKRFKWSYVKSRKFIFTPNKTKDV